MPKLDPKNVVATWIVEQEQAGVPALVGTVVKIQIQQVNPALRRVVIVPTTGSQSDERYEGIFGRIKPSVVMIQGDLLMASLGIIARRKL